ncbi:TPA: ead/Ea22-like family protein [Klebsiella quasipneumoniae subsp. quasipneumoniae]
MTTDITELAQGLKAAAEHYQSVQGIARYSKTVDAKERFLELANPANIIALVEALEKAQTENTAGAAGMAESYETTISMLRSRIAELEESHAQVIQSRDHYKRMSEEGLKQLAKSRTVTVKLVDINEFLADVHDKTLALAFRRLAEGVREADIAALTAQGIKWEAE